MSYFDKLLLKLYRKAKKLDKTFRYQKLRGKYSLSDSFKFNGEDILFYGDGEITIGKNSYIGGYSTIQVSNGYSVIIGENCAISHNVRIYTTSVIPDQDLSISSKLTKGGNVIIENYVWIGANVFINPGVTIGENAVVGANSVVTKDVLPNSIVGGVPAKIIRLKRIDA